MRPGGKDVASDTIPGSGPGMTEEKAGAGPYLFPVKRGRRAGAPLACNTPASYVREKRPPGHAHDTHRLTVAMELMPYDSHAA